MARKTRMLAAIIHYLANPRIITFCIHAVLKIRCNLIGQLNANYRKSDDGITEYTNNDITIQVHILITSLIQLLS